MIDIKDITHSLKNMTSNPGVYRMYDSDNKVIYVGKAKNLKKRVSSYFRAGRHSVRIKRMISLIKKIDITITKSEADAFLFENIQIFKLSFFLFLNQICPCLFCGSTSSTPVDSMLIADMNVIFFLINLLVPFCISFE